MSEQKQMIHVGPQNWKETVPILILLLREGDAKGRMTAVEELRKMATAADLWNESQTEQSKQS